MELTRWRHRMLEGWLAPGDYDDWSCEWIDGYGGLLRVVQKGDDRIFFSVEVLRGPTYQKGGLAGMATINRQLARFSDKDSAEDRKPDSVETWLSFQLAVAQFEITGANTG